MATRGARRFQPDSTQKLGLGAFIAGGLLVLAGDRLSLAQVTAVGTLLLATVPAVIGFQAMLTGHLKLPIDRYGEYQESYNGVGARTCGLLFLLTSAALAIYGLLKLAGIEHEAESLLDRWPSLAAIAIGLGLFLFGIAQASKVVILRQGQVRRICMLPERIGGAFTALIGLTLLGGGLLHAVSRVLFQKVMNFLGRLLLDFLQH
jgi:hypothetical protein